MPLGPYPRLKRFSLGEIPSYEILADDFDRIEDEAQDIGLAFHFAIFCLSVAITLTVTLATVPIVDWSIKATFILVTLAGYILGMFFGILAFRQRERLKKMMQKIRDRQIPPELGQKGDAESQELPSESDDGGRPISEEKA